jgi:hypothetical protein
MFKTIVCRYISQFSQHRKSTIVSDTIRNVITPSPFQISSTLIDILVAAILKACKHDKQSEDLLRVILWSSLFTLVTIITKTLSRLMENQASQEKNRK